MTRRMLARILAGALTGTKKLLSPSAQRPCLTINKLPKFAQGIIDEQRLYSLYLKPNLQSITAQIDREYSQDREFFSGDQWPT